MNGLLALVAVVVACFPAYTMGLLVGGWYVYGMSLPEGVGFLGLASVLSLTALIGLIRYRRSGLTFKPSTVYLASVSVPMVIALREVADPLTTFATWRNVAGFVLIGLLVATSSANPVFAKRMAIGFICPNLIFTVAEILRVLEGGTLHYYEVAFDANPIFVGHFVAFSLILTVALNAAGSLGRWMTVAIFAILSIGVILLSSLGAILGLLIGFAYIFATNNRHFEIRDVAKKYFLLILIGVVSVSVVVGALSLRTSADRPSTLGSRTSLWQEAWGHVVSEPIWGVGSTLIFGDITTDTLTPRWYPHNIFLEAWAVYGIFAVVALICVTMLLWRSTRGHGRALILMSTTFFSLSGTLTASFNYWVGLALSLAVVAIQAEPTSIALPKSSRSSLSPVLRPNGDRHHPHLTPRAGAEAGEVNP